MATGFLYDPRFLDHDAGRGHPERRERLVSTMNHLEDRGWLGGLVRVEAAEADPAWIETVHDASYVARAEETCRAGAPFLDVADVGISRESCDVARLAAGGALAMADRIVAGDVDNGFALSRPPGHHAERGTALGFCLFNNVAIAARYLQRAHGVDKVLILDFDVHHGNGTVDIFKDRPEVLVCSSFQHPFYPNRCVNIDRPNIVNTPLPAGAKGPAFRQAVEREWSAALKAHRPEIILISAGFDAHREDPLGGLLLHDEDFRWVTEFIVDQAATHAQGRIVSALEGGYDLNALSRCAVLHVEALNG